MIATLFPGCAVKRDNYDVPRIPLPAHYRNAPAGDARNAISSPAESTARPAGSASTPVNVEKEWWRAFSNDELVALVDRGLANNQDVRIATLRLAQAKTRVDQARAGLLPNISAPLGMAIQAPGGAVNGGTPVGADNRTTQKSYQASARGTWRMDVWGEQRSLVEAANFQLWQAAFELENTQRVMITGVASNYIEFLSLNDRLRIARETEAVLSDMLAHTEKRLQAGDATRLELDQQGAAIFAARAAIPVLEQQREDALTNIAFLVGAVPASLKLSINGLSALAMPGAVPPIPSSLLFRRPDVRIAEARLLAADADVDVARARLLPPLDLSSQAGYSALALNGLFQPASLFWNAIGSLTGSIFDGGKRASELENARSIHEEMVETYARSISQAVKEVETALVAVRATGSRMDHQQHVITAARNAWDSSAEMFALGGVDQMALLDAERNYQRYLDEYQRLKAEYYRGFVNLFQAVGGDMPVTEPLPGKGTRPLLVTNRASSAATPAGTVAQPKTDLVAQSRIDASASPPVGKFWQVELPGMYHRSAVDATWRDLRARYPLHTGGRVMLPRLQGRIDDSAEDRMSWYRLRIGRFSSADAAHEFCAVLQADYQRCRVTASDSDETVKAPALAQKAATPPAAARPH